MYNIITISRQFGSGGRTIGREVAQRLGIPCYDKELIERTAHLTGFSEGYVAETAEDAPRTSGFSYSFLGRSSGGVSNADRIWFAEKQVILDLAQQGPCVIVGRCADYLLRDREDCLHVFVYADRAFRARRIVEQYGETAVEPWKRLAEKDKKRRLNYQYYTERKWGATENYHLCMNSGRLGLERAVELILNAVGGLSHAAK